MGTFFEGSIIKIQNKVAATNTNNTVTLYTVPSNSYAVLNVRLVAVNSASDKVNILDSATPYELISGVVTTLLGVHVGPGQSIAMVYGGAGTFKVDVSGVEFKNNP